MKFLLLNMQKSYLSFFRIIKFFPSRLRTTLYFLVKMIQQSQMRQHETAVLKIRYLYSLTDMRLILIKILVKMELSFQVARVRNQHQPEFFIKIHLLLFWMNQLQQQMQLQNSVCMNKSVNSQKIKPPSLSRTECLQQNSVILFMCLMEERLTLLVDMISYYKNKEFMKICS